MNSQLSELIQDGQEYLSTLKKVKQEFPNWNLPTLKNNVDTFLLENGFQKMNSKSPEEIIIKKIW